MKKKRGIRRLLETLIELIEELLNQNQRADGTVFTFGKPISQQENKMDVTLIANQKVQYLVTETKGGVPVNPTVGDSVALSSSDPDAQIVPDATPVPGSVASGFIVANPASTGKTAIQITEQVTLVNGTALPPVVNTVNITPVAAGSADGTTFVFGTPVAQ